MIDLFTFAVLFINFAVFYILERSKRRAAEEQLTRAQEVLERVLSEVKACPTFDDDIEFEHGCRECGKPTDCIYCSTECSNKNPCRHGNPPDQCDSCDFESDVAYDAARERN